MSKRTTDLALTWYKEELEKGLDNSKYTWAIFKNAFLLGYKQRQTEEENGKALSDWGYSRGSFSPPTSPGKE